MQNLDYTPHMGFALRALEPTEKNIQDAILRYLEIHPKVAWAHRFNTGAHVIQDDQTGRRRFIRYAFPGCSDILGQTKDGRFLAIEVKKPKGRVTDAQQEFLDLVSRNNGLSCVARGIDCVESLLTDWSNG